MNDIKAANGGTVPAEFGCVYCHNSDLTKTDPDTGTPGQDRMRDASRHFRDKASAHPVGYNLTNGADTTGHMLSTFDCKTVGGVYYGNGSPETNKCAADGTYYTPGEEDDLGDRSTELDCVDCHDVTDTGGNYLGYPEHGKPTAANPYMLRSVGVFNLSEANKEYDGVCRRCHGSATGAGGIASFKSTGKNLQLGGAKHEDGSDGTHAIAESDTTPLTVDKNLDGTADFVLNASKKQCTTCHDTHYSTTNAKLFAAGIEAGNGSKCTVCHFPGDADKNFTAHGHGMPTSSKGNTLNLGCTNCHDVTAGHDPVRPANGAKMLNTLPDPDTTGKSGKSLRSICTNMCHSAALYPLHGTGANTEGCIDCHDEHAEGSGSGSNRYMIPRNLPNNGGTTAQTFFQSIGDSYPEARLLRCQCPRPQGRRRHGERDERRHLRQRRLPRGRGEGRHRPAIWPLATYLGGASHSGGTGGEAASAATATAATSTSTRRAPGGRPAPATTATTAPTPSKTRRKSRGRTRAPTRAWPCTTCTSLPGCSPAAAARATSTTVRRPPAVL